MSQQHKPERSRLAEDGAACLLVLLAIVLARFALPVASEPAAAGLAAVISACAGIIALSLAAPRRLARTGSWPTPAAMLTLLVAGVLLLDPLTRNLGGSLPPFLLTVLLAAANVVIALRFLPAALVCVVLLALTLAPVWAAPAVELAGNPAWLDRLVIGASPLTAFAVPLELDYLRTNWFYAHSALGSMRYDYPGVIWIWTCLSLLPAALFARQRVAGIDLHRYPLAREAHS